MFYHLTETQRNFRWCEKCKGNEVEQSFIKEFATNIWWWPHHSSLASVFKFRSHLINYYKFLWIFLFVFLIGIGLSVKATNPLHPFVLCQFPLLIKKRVILCLCSGFLFVEDGVKIALLITSGSSLTSFHSAGFYKYNWPEMLLNLSNESYEGSQINPSPLGSFSFIDFNFICSLIIWPLLSSMDLEV